MPDLFENLFIIATLGVMLGVFIGIGIAIGMELVMRISGDGRTVILTMARTRPKDADRPDTGSTVRW